MMVNIKEQGYGLSEMVKCVTPGKNISGICYPDVGSCITATVVKDNTKRLVGTHISMFDKGNKNVSEETIRTALQTMTNLMKGTNGNRSFIIGWKGTWDAANPWWTRIDQIQDGLKPMGGMELWVVDLCNNEYFPKASSADIYFFFDGTIKIQMKKGGEKKDEAMILLGGTPIAHWDHPEYGPGWLEKSL